MKEKEYDEKVSRPCIFHNAPIYRLRRLGTRRVCRGFSQVCWVEERHEVKPALNPTAFMLGFPTQPTNWGLQVTVRVGHDLQEA